MAAPLPKSFKPKASKSPKPQPTGRPRGRPPKVATPAVDAVTVPLGAKKVAQDPAPEKIAVPVRPAPKPFHAPLPKADKAKSLLKAALKTDPAASEPEDVPLPYEAATPPAPTITHVNTALPQVPGRKITTPTKRVQTAAGKLSFDSVLEQQKAQTEIQNPVSDLLRYLKK